MFLLLLVVGCQPEEVTTCEALCDHMVNECEYDAYPSMDSCEQGCAYSQSEGADVDKEQQCIAKANCDTFGILECEHKFGLGSQ
jgi:hypothetical protein